MVMNEKEKKELEIYKSYNTDLKQLLEKSLKGWTRTLWEWKRSMWINFILWIMMYIAGLLLGFSLAGRI